MNVGTTRKIYVAYLFLFLLYITNFYYILLINKESSEREFDLWMETMLTAFFFDLIVLELGRIAIQLFLICRVNELDQNAFWSIIYYIIITKSIVDLFE